jgi:hypothetical protein
MTTLQEINSAIVSGKFNNDELNQIVAAIKFARNQITRKNTGSLVVGTPVRFTNSRSGATVYGTVDKVNRKFIHVRETNPGRLSSGIWRVPASMLVAV